MNRVTLPFGTTTVTSKGQLTIPVGVRTHLGIVAGARLAIEPLDDQTLRFTPVQGDIPSPAAVTYPVTVPASSTRLLPFHVRRNLKLAPGDHVLITVTRAEEDQ